MIELNEAGYTLRQMEGARVTIVTFPNGTKRKVIGPELTEGTKKRIVLAAGRQDDLSEEETDQLFEDRRRDARADAHYDKVKDEMRQERIERGDEERR